MAKKQTKKVEVEVPQVEETVVIEQPVVKVSKVEAEPKSKKNTWEVKDRVYYLNKHRTALSYSIKSSGLYFFDEELQYEREVKYCENQTTTFVDEMKGDQRLSHIIFRNGALFVPKEKTVLQKFLSLHHPHRDVLFYEDKPQVNAAAELDWLEIEADAMIVAKSLDIDKLEAVMRVELGSKVSNMSSKELKRDALLYAKKNPVLFLELVEDENVELRNIGIKATEEGILKLSQDQRTFKWGTNDRKLMTVPFDEHPYSALAQWFKTDEGMEIFSSIEKRLNM
tara:strand:- start:701 stop:1546 length:846 start_codon:yes stop_codon:yes gene_type:complete